MWNRLGPAAKLLLLTVPVGGLVAGAIWYRDNGPAGTASSVPTVAKTGAFNETAGGTAGIATPTAFPSTEPTTVGGSIVRVMVIAWNAHMNLMLANGGPDTTAGSLMEARGVNLNISRAAEDSYDPMKAGLVACATELSQGAADCTSGIHFATIMGDGGPYFLAGLNEMLAKLDDGVGAYTAEIIGGVGRSAGEDAFMGPPACAPTEANPKAAENCKGLLVSGVIMDGDRHLELHRRG